jgi:hypothetical protein
MKVVVEVEVTLEWNHGSNTLLTLWTFIVKVKYRRLISIEVKHLGRSL